MEDPPEVLGVAEHGSRDRCAGLVGCPDVPHHLESELAVAFDGIREGLRLITGADHHHEAAVVAVAPDPVEGQARRQVRGDRRQWLDHEEDQQEQAADVQLDDVEEGHRGEQHHHAGDEDVVDLAAQRPAPAECVEAQGPQHGDPDDGVQRGAVDRIDAHRIPQRGPRGIPEAKLAEEQEQRGGDERIRGDEHHLEREQVPANQGRCPPRVLATGAGTRAPWLNPGRV